MLKIYDLSAIDTNERKAFERQIEIDFPKISKKNNNLTTIWLNFQTRLFAAAMPETP